MSIKEDFGFEKLNRIPKKIIQDSIEEFRKKNPNKALNRDDLCFIVSENLERAYLKTEDDTEQEETIGINSEQNGEKKKKKYNGQHILKKMGLDRTKKITRKIDFYIYKYYSPKNKNL